MPFVVAVVEVIFSNPLVARNLRVKPAVLPFELPLALPFMKKWKDFSPLYKRLYLLAPYVTSMTMVSNKTDVWRLTKCSKHVFVIH